MPHFLPNAPLKARPAVRKSVVLLTTGITFSILFLSQLFTTTDNGDHDNDPMRYSGASAHFRKGFTPEQMENHYKAREAVMIATTGASIPKNQRPLVVPHVASSYFNTCLVSTDTSALHASLRRGPDDKEIEGRAKAKQPRDFDQVFAVIDRKRYYFHADRPAVQTIDYLGAGLDSDFDDAVKVARAVTEQDTEATLQDILVPISYVRTTRRDGWQAIINLGGVANKTVDGETKRSNVRRMVSVTRGYGKPCQAAFVRPREVVRINVLVAYSQRPHRLDVFLKMFAMYFDSTNSHLVRVVISTTPEEKAQVASVAQKHPQLNAERFLLVTSAGDEFGNFSRAVALREAAKLVPDDEIIFFSDADLVIGGNFLQNCRVNVVRGSQVWFPVMFSLYPYGKSLSSKDGMWRRSSYGMACMYNSDFHAVKGFGGKEETTFTGWGSEDVFLYNQFRDNEKYAVLRTLEPGLQHQWHGKDCEHNEHFESCMRTVYMTIGSQDAIAKLMVNAHVDIKNLTKDAVPV